MPLTLDVLVEHELFIFRIFPLLVQSSLLELNESDELLAYIEMMNSMVMLDIVGFPNILMIPKLFDILLGESISKNVILISFFFAILKQDLSLSILLNSLGRKNEYKRVVTVEDIVNIGKTIIII